MCKLMSDFLIDQLLNRSPYILLYVCVLRHEYLAILCLLPLNTSAGTVPTSFGELPCIIGDTPADEMPSCSLYEDFI